MPTEPYESAFAVVVTRALWALLALVFAGCGKAKTSDDNAGIPAASHQFGVVGPSTYNAYQFRTINSFSDTLQISNIWTSCGCTALTPEERAIAPGQTIAVNMTYRAPEACGTFGAQAIIYGHVGQRSVELAYSAHAKVANILAIPVADNLDYIDFGRWQIDTVPTTVVKELEYGGYPLQFDELHIRSEISEISVTPSVSRDRVRLQCNIQASNVVGSIGGPLECEFFHHGRRLNESQVFQGYISFVGPVSAVPPSIVIRSHGKSEVTEKIALRSSDGLAPKCEILSANTDIENVSCHFDNIRNPGIVIVKCNARTWPIGSKSPM